MVTDPYRPPVWTTSSNDTPLVVESDHKFPTVSARENPVMTYRNGDKSQTHIKMPSTKLQNLVISSKGPVGPVTF